MTDNSPKKRKFRKIYLKKYYKLIPIFGILLLIILSIGQDVKTVEDAKIENLGFKAKVTKAYNDFIGSFIFSDKLDLAFTIILLVTIWTGYKYWLTKVRYIRKNTKLLEKIVITIMIILFLGRHVKANSPIGKYFDWVMFLLFLYLIIAGWWYLVKTIDSIDLSSDLYCWGLGILGVIVLVFGIFMLTSSAFYMTFKDSKLVFENISWILSLAIVLLGIFMSYRAARRRPALHIW